MKCITMTCLILKDGQISLIEQTGRRDFFPKRYSDDQDDFSIRNIRERELSLMSTLSESHHVMLFFHER